MPTNPRTFPAIQSAIFSYLSVSSRFHSTSISSMAAVPENGTVDAPTLNDNVKIGFQRPEMYSEKLSGTSIAYDRHVILCYKTHELWPSRVESSDAHPLPKVLAGALKARKNDIPVKTLLTICEGREGTELSDGDVLLFPEMIKYRGLKESDINTFVDEVVVNRKLWSAGVQETMTGSHVFVCSHSSRDKRCGFCGPILIKKFKEEAELRGLDNVSVTACSHVGGHKYAGNLIIYSVQDKKVCGHWYGYVTPSDVPELLDNHIVKGEIIDRIWRGQMGVPVVKKAEKAIEQSLPNGNDVKVSEADHHASSTIEEKDREKEKERENNGGCCQGANGFSCCRDETPETETEKEVNKVLGAFNTLRKKWEKHDVVTVAAVVGAVVTVAVAYSFYRRLR
ncbi:putative thioredoxin-like ferredoxin, Thioredoxin-like superfamily [Helianthus annuus]|uniref:Putative sucrase/ferredoxin-like family protein n=1 Tax=Helianthus annuus TaxID=4232 RepID=A0A251RQX6_HELAN|nr:altered inheritance of mitochondria protein 32 [Helianthus annuus]KAF5755171.1 putative thioredoxin-like ferredoxin, Thioredoxin-like superfamily [Helianthus annuus]KAJ0812901.1 putative thioredoxin-like ferredoxin, Thioredoxin-like superfamily [Helianthus annuus]